MGFIEKYKKKCEEDYMFKFQMGELFSIIFVGGTICAIIFSLMSYPKVTLIIGTITTIILVITVTVLQIYNIL